MDHAIEEHLRALVADHPDRHVGGPGNAAATDYVEAVLHDLGFEIGSTPFEALDWEHAGARLVVDGAEHHILPSPYTLPVEADAVLVAVDTVAALERADLSGRIVLLHGEIAADQLFPKSFTFIDTPEHRHIIELLEAKQPAAVVSATGRGSGMAGSLYPYSLIEDGDFDIPSAYTTDVAGADLVERVGRQARLSIRSRRFMAPARQLVGRMGPGQGPRIVVIAHIDSKEGSPGAIDNATGVAGLLAIAESLTGYEGPYRLEFLPMNGEDYFASSGEHLFVGQNQGRWDEIALAVNMDAIGGRDAGTAVSLYGCPDSISAVVRDVVDRHDTVQYGEEWYESDHSIVAMNGRPAMALTSTTFRELCATVTHTERDTLDVVDPATVGRAADFVADLVGSLPADAHL